MQIAAVGVGGAGAQIVDRLWQENESRETTYLGAACAVDTDVEALQPVIEYASHPLRSDFESVVSRLNGVDAVFHNLFRRECSKSSG